MKSHARHLTAALLSSALPFAALSCKKEDAASSAAQASSSSSAAASSGSSVEVSASAWGFAARLPRSTEGFVALYRASDLVEGFLGSNWMKKLSSHPAVGQQIQAMLASFESDPQAKEVIGLLKEVAGKEVVFAVGDGFTANVQKLASAVVPVFKTAFLASMQKQFKPAAEAGAASLSGPGDLLKELSPQQIGQMVSALVEADVPSFLMAVKAGAVKEKLDAMFKQGLGSLPPEMKQVVDEGSFKLDGKYDFQSLTFKVSKLPVPDDVASAELQQFTAMMGSAEKAKAVLAKAKTKTVEVSWGWVDDSLVISLGKDHSHVKLASLADSVLSLPEVSVRAGAWQAKKPLSLAYISKATNHALGEAFGGIMGTLISLAEAGADKAPFPIAPIIADMKKLDARSKEIWPNDPDAIVASSWWDGGLHVEGFGGAKPRGMDASKPLTYGSLAGPTTLFLAESRINEAESDKTYAFVEEAASTLYGSFQKNILPKLPDEQKNQITMAAGMGVGMIQAVWKNFQQFRASLGGESAVLVNLDGTMPPLPNLPADLKDAKFPRVVVVSDLKDRAKLAESWKGIGGTIGLALSLAKMPATDPVEMKDGDLTTWGYKLPMDTGDLWPHTGVSGTRWLFGTSPSFTKTIAAKAAAAAGPPSGAHVHINFDALWTMAEDFISRIPAEGANQKEMMTSVLPFLRALGELDARCGEDKGAAHHHLFLHITDLK